MPKPLAESLALLEPHASRLKFAPPTKKTALATFEKAVGALPEDVRTWYAWHDGQSERKAFHDDDVFTALSAAEALSAWKFLRGEADADRRVAAVNFAPRSDRQRSRACAAAKPRGRRSDAGDSSRQRGRAGGCGGPTDQPW